MNNRKKVLELCIYIALLICLFAYTAHGGYTPKASQVRAPPKQEYRMPTPEPRKVLEG